MLRSFEVQVVSTVLSCMAWIALRLPSYGSQAGNSGLKGLKASNVEYIVPCSRGNVDIWGLQGLYRDNGKEHGIH